MQSPTLQCESEMPEHIFKAIERLMAEEGLHNLSMHKIAKEANISAGTIYIYFKSKDELLEKFAYHLFLRFDQVLKKRKIIPVVILSNIKKCGGMFGLFLMITQHLSLT